MHLFDRSFACLLLLVTMAGCTSERIHLSFQREQGDPTEEPGNGPSGIPIVSGNVQSIGSGGIVSQSERFKNFGTIRSGPEQLTQGTLYRSVGVDVGLAQQVIGGEE